MPPGWSHTGDHKMTTVVKKKYFEELQRASTHSTDQPNPQNEKPVLS
jgi:hypothetical protein